MKDLPGRVLVSTDCVGGVWQYSLDLARELSARGTGTILVAAGPAAAAHQRAALREIEGAELVEPGIPLDWLAGGPDDILRAGQIISAIAGDLSADIVQLNNPAYGAFGGFHVPVVAAAHSCLATWWAAVEGSPLPPDFAWRAALHRKGLMRANACVAPSHAFAAATEQVHRLSRRPGIVRNGRSIVSPITPTSEPAAAVVAMGRLWDRAKNAALLDALAAQIDVPVHALGPTRGPNGEMVELAHLCAHGELCDGAVGTWLSRRPIHVSASLYEPFGLGVLEAAGAGCALVLSDIPTFRELWDGCATFCPPRDAAAFASAVRSLLEDGEKRALRAAKAEARARHFTREAFAAAMIDVYRRVLSAAPHELAGA